MPFTGRVLAAFILFIHCMHDALDTLWAAIPSLFVNRTVEDQQAAFAVLSAGTRAALRGRNLHDISYSRQKRIVHAEDTFQSTESPQKPFVVGGFQPMHRLHLKELPAVPWDNICPTLTPSCPSPTLTESSNGSILSTPISQCLARPEASIGHTVLLESFGQDFELDSCARDHAGRLDDAKADDGSPMPLLPSVKDDATLFNVPESTTLPHTYPEPVNHIEPAGSTILDHIPIIHSPPPARVKYTHSIAGRTTARAVSSQRRSMLQMAAYTIYSISCPPSGLTKQDFTRILPSPHSLPV